MQWLMVTILGLGLMSAAAAEDIVDVLRRSQQQRLDALKPAVDGPRAQAVRRSYETLVRLLAPLPPTELRVITGAVLAETLHGRVIVVNGVSSFSVQ